MAVQPAGLSVTQLHNHANRDGLYTEPSFTAAAVKTIHVDPGCDGAYPQVSALCQSSHRTAVPVVPGRR